MMLKNISLTLVFPELIIMKLGNWHLDSKTIERNYERNFFVKTPWYKTILRRRYRSLKSILFYFFRFLFRSSVSPFQSFFY